MSERVNWTYHKKGKARAAYAGMSLGCFDGEELKQWGWWVDFEVGANISHMSGWADTEEMAKRRAVAVAVRFVREGHKCPFALALAKGWVSADGEPVFRSTTEEQQAVQS